MNWFAVCCVLSTPVMFWLSRSVFGDGDGPPSPRPHVTDWYYDALERKEQADKRDPVPLANSLANLHMYGVVAQETAEGAPKPLQTPDVSWIEFDQVHVWGGRQVKRMNHD